MFEGFTTFDVPVRHAFAEPPVVIHGVRGGNAGGPPLLLLHGFPESHVMWAPIATALAATHLLVVPDLRGYGDSTIPAAGEDHAGYSFRAMAQDQAALLTALGVERAAVVGHDRGARVAHRFALDHPDRLDRVALLDILPTAWVFEHLDRRVALAYYHWFFLAQPAPLPERLIDGDPELFLRRFLGGWGTGGPLTSHPEGARAYGRSFADPRHRQAMVEDYRAAASIDLRHDRESAAAGDRVDVPVLVLWGSAGVVGGGAEDPRDVWRAEVGDGVPVTGGPIAGAGHFLVEDDPAATLAALRRFLAGADR